jgi:hypothetical protein
MGRRWQSVRRVMTDVGQHDEVPIQLERTPDGGYAFRLGLRAGFGGQDTARIAISHRLNPDPHPILKEIHGCEVAGLQLEAANVFALRAKVATLIEAIAPSRALPLCYFRAPAMDYELPIYEDRGVLSSPLIGGPRLRAPDLAGIRGQVCRHLVTAGYVREPDEVTVGVLRPSDLRRVPPAAVFRSLDDPEVWLPSVEGVSAEGPVVGMLGRAARLQPSERPRTGAGRAGPVAEATAPAAPDVVELLRALRASDVAPGLYAADVRPEIWAAARQRTEPTARRLLAHLSDDEGTELELPIARTGAGELVAALEDRGITVFLAATESALAAAVGRYLAGAGFVRFATEVERHDVRSPRAEQLDPAAITSHLEPRRFEPSWPSS